MGFRGSKIWVFGEGKPWSLYQNQRFMGSEYATSAAEIREETFFFEGTELG